ncbi:enoyl-CoA hydratase/isomerase family protein, partial [Cooperia oncophora]
LYSKVPGEKAFCAGGDVLAVIKSAKEAKEGGKCTVHKDFFREEYQLNHLIGNLSKTFVALIDGIVMGGGCGLSVNGRYRVATERTMLAMPETALGLFPDVGGSYFLSRLKNNLGLYLALSGYRLHGADAYHAGLATHYVPSAKLADLQGKLLSLKTVTDKSVDATIREFEPSDIPAFTLEEHLPTISKTFSARSVEEIFANLKKDGSEWSQKQLKTLSKMSPTSMKVTFKQLEHGAKMSFSKVFTMEYRLTQRSLEDHDFYEGCRAILIDKDRNPKWKPATLEEVSDSHIEQYFAPLGREDIFLDSSTSKI